LETPVGVDSTPIKTLIKNFLRILSLLLFSYCYVFLIPWETLLDRGFTDIERYAWKFDLVSKNGVEEGLSIKKFIFNEVLWEYFLQLIGLITGEYRVALGYVSIVAFSIYLGVALNKLPVFLTLLLIFNPMFVDLIMSQIRIALAFSLILISFFKKNKILQLSLLFSAVLIHTAVLALIAIFLLIRYLVENLGHTKKVYAYCFLMGLSFSIFSLYGLSNILEFLGDRRSYTVDKIQGSSVLYASFWMILMFFISLFSKVDKPNIYYVCFAIVMASIFFFNSLLGIYGQRYLVVGLIPIFISITSLDSLPRCIVILALLAYQLVQYLYWFNITVI